MEATNIQGDMEATLSKRHEGENWGRKLGAKMEVISLFPEHMHDRY